MNRRDFLMGGTALVGMGCQSVTARPGRTLKVMTYNLHHGEGLDGRVDERRIGELIRQAQPDLVAVQEADRGAERTKRADQPAIYQQVTGLHGWYGPAMPFQGGEYGQMLLSRWPLVEPKVFRLPGTPGSEPRIATTALVDVPGIGRIRWVNAHLDASRADNDRWEQAGALLQEFGRDGVPTLMGGDFNDTPESRVMQRLLAPTSGWEDTAALYPAPTNPANDPRTRIDYILSSPRGRWQVVEAVVLPDAVASDHRPVVATLRWLR